MTDVSLLWWVEVKAAVSHVGLWREATHAPLLVLVALEGGRALARIFIAECKITCRFV